MADILTLILAAGRSTRMKSSLSKILHPVASRPMIEYVFELGQKVSQHQLYTIINPELETRMNEAYGALSHFILQAEQKGTGHAVKIALDAIEAQILDAHEWLLILYGDSPLLTQESLTRMLAERSERTAIILSTMRVESANQYGRVIAENGAVQKIVEFKDAADHEKAVTLCNGGVMLIRTKLAKAWLATLGASQTTGEFYLTDLIEKANLEGHHVGHVDLPIEELTGVNRRAELAHVESVMQERLREKAMAGGATLIDPKTVYLAYDTQLGQDVLIEPNVFFGPKVVVADQVHIKAFSHLEACHLKSCSKVGPFARIRPGTIVGEHSAVGNFVEVKNSILHHGVKAGHLSYLGDAEIFDEVNIGAGTITCNYDGQKKHRTEIGSKAFIGSNTALVAPVKIGKEVLVGAGSVITKDVEDGALAIARGKQKNIERKKK